MGRTPPPPPYLPVLFQRLDLSLEKHQELYARYEAEREYDAWLEGRQYQPSDIKTLRISQGVIHVSTQVQNTKRR